MSWLDIRPKNNFFTIIVDWVENINVWQTHLFLHTVLLFIVGSSRENYGVLVGVACVKGGAVREWWEELREDRPLRLEGEEEEEEGEEGTALTWVTGWTHDVV